MLRRLLLAGSCLLALGGVGATFLTMTSNATPQKPDVITTYPRPPIRYENFSVDILVDGRPLEEFNARGKTYIEALEGAEYEVRIRNPYPYRVAVALSVDGLNSIDARRTSAWNASKWVIEPFGTISVGGWQMSSSRARRFYFTTERDSYAAKLGQTSNLGVISAVFFREIVRPPKPITILPPPTRDSSGREKRAESSPKADTQASAGNRSVMPQPDDESAATGIGRSVQNDVQWISMDLDSRAASEVTIRYEYYPALVRLGILPRHYSRTDSLRRRESSTGFSPEP
jgi:hypothetical protein